MPWIRIGDTIAHVRMANPRRKRCPFCGFLVDELVLCDFVLERDLLGEETLCNQQCCRVCARQVGEDKDYCPRHS